MVSLTEYWEIQRLVNEHPLLIDTQIYHITKYYCMHCFENVVKKIIFIKFIVRFHKSPRIIYDLIKKSARLSDFSIGFKSGNR